MEAASVSMCAASEMSASECAARPRRHLAGHEGQDQRERTGQPSHVRAGRRAVLVPIGSAHDLTISSPIGEL
jgi:hypothetical protein